MDQLDVMIRQCRELIDWYNPSCLLEGGRRHQPEVLHPW